jgi:hypothetical protein
MFTYNSKFSVKKPINDVFKSIFEIPENKEKSVEEDNINDNVYKVIEWDINNWSIINGKRRKLENIYIYVNDLPEYLKELVIENDNFIRMRRKHTIINNGEKYKEIITKNYVTNLKSAYLFIMKALDTLKLVKIKEKVSLTYVNDKETCVDIVVKVDIPIVLNDELEKYLKMIFECILDNIKKKLIC